MFAGRFSQPGRIELIDVPEQTLAADSVTRSGDILFQPRVACLCGSDLPYFNGEPPEYPGTIGHSLHEMVGTVLDTNGTRFRPGDQVLAVPVNQRGLFERFVVSESRAIPVDARLPLDRAIFAQPLGTVLYAMKKVPSVLDQDVVVVGQGPIGQMFNAVLRNLGAREIIVADKLESRLRLSSRMGATHVVHAPQNSLAAEVSRATDGRMADLVIEAVGHADQAFHECVPLCRHGGRILTFGVPPEKIDGVPWREVFYKNLSIHTSVNPDFARDFPLAMRWLAEGRIDLSPLATHRFPIHQIQIAYETFRDRVDGAQKVLLDFPSA